MAKKRRHVASTQRASATTNREKPIDHEAIKKSLETLGAYYDRLSGEVVGIPARLERTLLLHSLVVLVVQNALMVVQVFTPVIAYKVTVTAIHSFCCTPERANYTICVVGWNCRLDDEEKLRGVVSASCPLRVGSGREIGLRILILVLGMSGLGALYYRNEIPSDTLHIVAFAAVGNSFRARDSAAHGEKKKSKSKSHISSMKTITSGNDSSALQTNRSIFKEPRVQLALLTLVQILLLLTQLVLSALVLYSWEMTSSHVLWTLGQVRRKVLSRCTVRSADQKLKSE
ncbi:hypothetical protein AM588_10002427 [Phytophthora nicotianae]|uniref:Uncharacterized protein n=1 Tax=Phytophthora nicotianae TaxID=4792 RepID=A0A0W8D0I0_PHYNI|nr:hypothetical protein AM588_10002427 [Phytophthora nicotianae]